ncbi:Panacea domain-containing protein [Domibacillus robiginosus]|uniref:Panacea domain-containing protein n=1 Tax=Domibacillus robiginosus TaxID=1071054 RepID=UPI00067D1516|nr:type II toxin-antitoxin system antitoxin SocA domain-containing protein [Domibacillus robiginosus]
MPKATDVAAYLLSLSKPNTPWAVTPLKLQKLLYYCQGWHMAFSNGEALFEDDIVAWEHGPVVRDIYFEYKDYRYLTIPAKPFHNKTKKGKPIFTKRQQEILNSVWDAYGQYDGKYLEELTHQEKPWLTTPRDSIIQKRKISKFFFQLAQEA